jgi:hypothetical protein
MKSKNVYEVVFYLAFLLFLAASVLCYYYLNEDSNSLGKITTGVVVCGIVEVFLFICIVVSIKKGASRLLTETKSNEIVKDLYQRIQFPSMFAIAYGIMQIVVSEIKFGGLLVYGLNIMGFGVFFFVWMRIKIYKINKQMRL